MRRLLLASACAALFVLATVSTAHAVVGVTATGGYGATFGDGGTQEFGPTAEAGAYLSVPFIKFDVGYYKNLDDKASVDSKGQARLGLRVCPPLIGLYGRAAVGIPLDKPTRDASGYDLLLGGGYSLFSLGIAAINAEIDYHHLTEGGSKVYPFEFKLGLDVGF